MLGQQYHYSSTLGTICVVPRPSLANYEARDGLPVAVSYPNTYGKKGRSYSDLKGILLSTYQEVKPDLVVYELGNGSLLAATKEVLDSSVADIHFAYRYRGCITTDVSKLKILQELPEKLDIPIFNFE
ncbi:hypothetical protein [Chroococcidiopsis sp. CCMEE 29]|uniref:hypothetical protein n=1 Tax=Chroococcidiopsis sp. CCMEE 29 TaxID=155894 RepID=UPI002020EEAA|nr:hypothetical protein [Chroococcidiopsis sp. CCMEE 29]